MIQDANKRKMVYIIIGVVCIIAILIGIITEVASLSNTKKTNTTSKDNTINQETIQTQEELKKDFLAMFKNSIDFTGIDDSKILKNDSSKKIVYTAYNIQQENDKYDVDIVLPVININSDVASDFNGSTQYIFANKATEILNNTQSYTVYSVSYTGYINNNILSVIIKSTLKEGTSAQRIIVQTYNYNLETGKEVTLQEEIATRSVTTSQVTNTIKSRIEESISESNDIQESGYSLYTRDINNEMYTLANTNTYFLGPDGDLYIIYAYGNQNVTSEMDIIKI